MKYLDLKRTTFCLIVSLIALIGRAEILRAEEAPGKEVFLGEKCNICHAVSSAGVEAKTPSEKMKGPDLSTTEYTDLEWMARYIRQDEELDGKKHKKGFKGSEDDMTAMLEWLVENSAAASSDEDSASEDSSSAGDSDSARESPTASERP